MVQFKREFNEGVRMPKRQDDDVIDFTPAPGFVIEQLAVTIVQMMQDLDMDAHINLPDGTVVEVERDCTEKEIVDGYKDYLAGRIKARTPSNKNEREPAPVK